MACDFRNEVKNYGTQLYVELGFTGYMRRHLMWPATYPPRQRKGVHMLWGYAR